MRLSLCFLVSVLFAGLALYGCGDDRPNPIDGGRTDSGRDSGGRDAGDCTPTGPENTPEACMDGMDNDCNTFRDCEDLSCTGMGSCVAMARENSNPQCSDGIDNDGNGSPDCDDFDCEDRLVCSGEGTNEQCSDMMDNDDDGMMDCADPGCQAEAIVVCDGASAVDPLPGMAEWPALIMAVCSDEMDNNGNTFFDCGDNSCQLFLASCGNTEAEQSNATCSDGVDNDMDGMTDCQDSRCQDEGIAVCDGTTEVTVAPGDYEMASNMECSNMVNEDGDTGCSMGPMMMCTDCFDFGCQNNPDATVCAEENTDAACSDGMDNDGDTFADCRDFSCSNNALVTVCENNFENCSDGMDNDSNGFVDCADCSCNAFANDACSGDNVNPACF